MFLALYWWAVAAVNAGFAGYDIEHGKPVVASILVLNTVWCLCLSVANAVGIRTLGPYRKGD